MVVIKKLAGDDAGKDDLYNYLKLYDILNNGVDRFGKSGG